MSGRPTFVGGNILNTVNMNDGAAEPVSESQVIARRAMLRNSLGFSPTRNASEQCSLPLPRTVSTQRGGPRVPSFRGLTSPTGKTRSSTASSRIHPS